MHGTVYSKFQICHLDWIWMHDGIPVLVKNGTMSKMGPLIFEILDLPTLQNMDIRANYCINLHIISHLNTYLDFSLLYIYNLWLLRTSLLANIVTYIYSNQSCVTRICAEEIMTRKSSASVSTRQDCPSASTAKFTIFHEPH